MGGYQKHLGPLREHNGSRCAPIKGDQTPSIGRNNSKRDRRDFIRKPARRPVGGLRTSRSMTTVPHGQASRFRRFPIPSVNDGAPRSLSPRDWSPPRTRDSVDALQSADTTLCRQDGRQAGPAGLPGRRAVTTCLRQGQGCYEDAERAHVVESLRAVLRTGGRGRGRGESRFLRAAGGPA